MICFQLSRFLLAVSLTKKINSHLYLVPKLDLSHILVSLSRLEYDFEPKLVLTQKQRLC